MTVCVPLTVRVFAVVSVARAYDFAVFEDKVRMPQVKLCIPIRLCGAIIGKGGQTVRAFMDDCKADIRLRFGV